MSHRPGRTLLAFLAVALVVGFFLAGSAMYKSAIGLDPSAFPASGIFDPIGSMIFPDLGMTRGGVALAMSLVLLVGALTFFAVRGAARSQADPARRSFLTGSLWGAGGAIAATAAGGGALFARAFRGVGNEGRGWQVVASEIFAADVAKTHPEWKSEWKGSRVQGYRRLGRTEWQVSDVVMGSGPLKREKGAEIVKLALDRGVNYIDTSPDYSASGSELAVGEGIAGRDRGSMFLATKFCTPKGHLPPGTDVAVYKRNVEESLGRLGTEYVDLVHVHSCDEIDRLLDPNMLEAFRQLKAEGKARFLGFSTHTPNLVQVTNAAIDSGKFDVMMLAYHHGIWSKLGSVIERARSEQDMGVVAMKTLKGARHHGLAGFREEADAYSQAALKWVLTNDDVSCAVISMFELQQVDEYLYASGGRPSAEDLALLRKYDREILGSYCAPHCGACLDACPEKLQIHDVLRHRMYFEDYGWEKEGMRLYSQLEKQASVCAGCSAPCTGSCPVGIPIQERALGAHELLTLS